MLEPRAEPICTIGPSRPAEPPEPMQRAEATALAMDTRARIRLRWRMTDSMTCETPGPWTSWEM